MNFAARLVFGAAAVLTLACGAQGDTWRADVYPDASDLGESVYAGTYETLAACRAAARRKLDELGSEDSGDYECGKNCEPLYPELGSESVQVCEETVK